MGLVTLRKVSKDPKTLLKVSQVVTEWPQDMHLRCLATTPGRWRVLHTRRRPPQSLTGHFTRKPLHFSLHFRKCSLANY